MTGLWSVGCSCYNILHELGWQQLEDGRRDLRLALMYKIVHGLVAVAADSLKLTPKDIRTRTSYKHTCRHLPTWTDPARYFFTNRTIPDWSPLPDSTAEAPSVVSFKAQLAVRPHGDQSVHLHPNPLAWLSVKGTANYLPYPDQTRPDQTRPDQQCHFQHHVNLQCLLRTHLSEGQVCIQEFVCFLVS